MMISFPQQGGSRKPLKRGLPAKGGEGPSGYKLQESQRQISMLESLSHRSMISTGSSTAWKGSALPGRDATSTSKVFGWRAENEQKIDIHEDPSIELRQLLGEVPPL
jgi:hypothetical protein